jgi:hypothetical protein
MRLAPFAAALLALSCDACAGSNDVLIASGQSVGFGGVVSGGAAEKEQADTRLDLARLTGAVGSDYWYRRFVDGFVGIAIPVSGCTIGLCWDRLGLESLVRRTVTFSVSMLIGETA